MAPLSATSSEWPPFTGCHRSSPVMHLLHTVFRVGTPHHSSRDLSLPRLPLVKLGHFLSPLPTQPLSTFNCDKLPIQVYHTKLTQATIDHGASQYDLLIFLRDFKLSETSRRILISLPSPPCLFELLLQWNGFLLCSHVCLVYGFLD